MEYERRQKSSSSDRAQSKRGSESQPVADDFTMSEQGRSSFNIANIPAYASQQGTTQPILMASAIAVPGGAAKMGLWEFMKREIIKRSPGLAAKVAGLSLVDGALPIGELIGLGLTLWTIKDIYDAYQVYMSKTEQTEDKADEEDKKNESEEAKKHRHGGGKNAQHGKKENQPSKERQIKELEEQAKNATGSEKKKILQKIKNIKQKMQRDKKGENHSQRDKGR